MAVLPSTPNAAHDYLLERFAALLEILMDERQALVGTSPELLQALVERKETVCADIARAQQTLLDALKPDTTLPDSMTELRTLAARCRTENALNGKIANRARRSAHSLLAILTGDSGAGLYDRPGADAGSGRTPGHHLGSA